MRIHKMHIFISAILILESYMNFLKGCLNNYCNDFIRYFFSIHIKIYTPLYST